MICYAKLKFNVTKQSPAKANIFNWTKAAELSIKQEFTPQDYTAYNNATDLYKDFESKSNAILKSCKISRTSKRKVPAWKKRHMRLMRRRCTTGNSQQADLYKTYARNRASIIKDISKVTMKLKFEQRCFNYKKVLRKLSTNET